MGKTNSWTMSTHWDECWKHHPDCFWSECIRRGVQEDTTAEYQAYLLYRKEVINNERRSS